MTAASHIAASQEDANKEGIDGRYTGRLNQSQPAKVKFIRLKATKQLVLINLPWLEQSFDLTTVPWEARRLTLGLDSRK